MKYLASLIILGFGILTAKGQGTVTLSGQVKDEQTSKVLEFCNVSYYSFQDSLISGTATNQKCIDAKVPDIRLIYLK